MTHTIKEITRMSNEDFMAIYDKLAQGAYVSGEFYHDEYVRRNQDKQTKTMIRFTKYIAWMTYMITIATIVNVVIACQLLRR